MTRRDNCRVCKERVGDNDVMCCKCGESFCNSCPTSYDVFSRLALLHARFTVLCEPTINATELTQFIADITSNDYKNVINSNVLYDEDYKQEIFEAIRLLSENKNITNDNITDFFVETLDDNNIDFICLACYNG